MSESKEKEGKKPLRLSRPRRLELEKTVETGQVRQSFPHGRSRSVTVEVKRKRTFTPGAGGRMTELKPSLQEAMQPTPRQGAMRTLTEQEKAARVRALQDAFHAEEEGRHRDDIDALLRSEEERRRRAEEEAAREAEERRRAEEEARTRQRTEEEATRRAQAEETPERRVKPAAAKPEREGRARTLEEEEEEERARRGRRRAEARRHTPSLRRMEPRRRKLTVTQVLDGDHEAEERGRSLAAVRRARERERQRAEQQPQEPVKVVREVVIPEAITVQELANRMAERGADVIKALMKMGVMATINQTIDADTAEIITREFGHKVKRVSEADVEIGLKGEEDVDTDLKPRAPVVTVMGHVDHGKTSLLDVLRETDVAQHEAGGITQHIGAYRVKARSGDYITFLDTPGHEAFTAMRARGANVTDIVVLVVAADDGIKEQTVEAINHAQAAKVPVVVAINKIDRPDADPNRVRTQLLQHGVVLEEVGGDILGVEVSAKEKTNLDKLEEALLLQAELLELKANPDRPAEGVIVEAKLERGRGPVATVLVRRGTLRVGDVFVAGSEWGRVRAMVDERGQQVQEAGPSVPVEVLGLQGTPSAGDDFVAVDNEGRAREIADYRQRQLRERRAAGAPRGTLEQMFTQIAEGQAAEMPMVVKADVQGSLEAILGSVEKLSTDEVSVRVLHAGVGGINESDVQLAKASNAVIIGFNVRANPQARELARREDIEIRYYSIIYDLIDDLKKALSGMLMPEIREQFLGTAEVREVFNISKVGKVAGCRVTEGAVRRGAKVRLLRDSVVVHEGAIASLRRFKEEAREVKEGYECGIALENYQDVQVGDVIECFEMEEVARSL